MGFLDTTPASFELKVYEDDIQNKLDSLLTTIGGWKKGKNNTSLAANFKKVVFDSQMTNPNGAKPEIADYSICVAEHFIYINNAGKMFGLAIVGEWEQRYGLLEKKPVDGLVPFGVWATNQFRKYRTPQYLYFYMVENLKGLENRTGDIVMGWENSGTGLNNTLRRAALDIEVETTEWFTGPGISTPLFRVATAQPDRMQSPISSAGLRTHLLEKYYDDKINSAVKFTNWWYDSEIAMRGHLDENSIFVVLQADTVPAPEGNLVPSIPFYFGKLETVEEGDDAVAMFTGSIPPHTTLDGAATYDYDSTAQAIPTLMPLLKSYPRNPSNGIASVMVSRAKFGARYQAHYLSWNTPPNTMPPARTDITSRHTYDYPKAWNNAENPLYKYQFNPSRYSNKVHTSKVYVVHPEEGVRGSLINTIGFAAISFNASKLRVKSSHCPDQFDVYRYFMIDGVSPLTKKPGTQYRPMGLGIYTETVDKDGKAIEAPRTENQ